MVLPKDFKFYLPELLPTLLAIFKVDRSANRTNTRKVKNRMYTELHKNTSAAVTECWGESGLIYLIDAGAQSARDFRRFTL